MTNKPMLSVERELLEDMLNPCADFATHERLRALLDKTEDKICSVCNGFGRYQDGGSGTDEDGRCPNIVYCDCGDSERIPEYRSKPAARNQGEPVAYTTAGMLEIAKRLPLTGRIGAKATKDERWNIPLFLDHDEQPAPVAVALLKRLLTWCPEVPLHLLAEIIGELNLGDDERKAIFGSQKELRRHMFAPLAVVMPERDIASELVEMMNAPSYFDNVSGVDHSKWFKWDWSERKARPINKHHLCDVVLSDGRVLFDQSPHDFDWTGDDVAAARQGCSRETARLNGVKP